MSKTTEAQIRQRLSRLAEKQGKVAEKFQTLMMNANASSSEIESLVREQTRLATQQAELMASLRVQHLQEPKQFGSYGVVAAQRPMREQVLDVLEAIGVPASPRLISQFAAVRYGLLLPIARFASLRRDEERAYKKDPTSRPSWFVPAINVLQLVAIPRIVATSAWEPERRLIGPRTLRVNHLRTLLAAVAARDECREHDEERAEELERFIARYAQSVIGTIGPGVTTDSRRVLERVQAELERIEPVDLEERRLAAARLERLPGAMQFWGAPTVISDATTRAGGQSS